MASQSDTAIIIVTYNGMGCIDACLLSLESEPGIVVFVFDNASTDDTAGHVARQYPWVKLTRTGSNLGFGRANNLGIAAALDAGIEFVLLLNQDTVVPPGSVAALRRFLEEHQEYGACSPLQCADDLLHPDPTTLRGYLGPNACEYMSDLIAGKPRTHYTVLGMSAAVWLVRADTFRRAGGFDPLFFMYGEDDDLMRRWRFHGVLFAFVPTIRIAHVRYRSPPAPNIRPPKELIRISRGAYTNLLLRAKYPGVKLHFILRVLLLRGFLAPLLDALLDGRVSRLLAHWLATLRLLSRVVVIARHARLVAQPGAHFLMLKEVARHTASTEPSLPSQGSS